MWSDMPNLMAQPPTHQRQPSAPLLPLMPFFSTQLHRHVSQKNGQCGKEDENKDIYNIQRENCTYVHKNLPMKEKFPYVRGDLLIVYTFYSPWTLLSLPGRVWLGGAQRVPLSYKGCQSLTNGMYNIYTESVSWIFQRRLEHSISDTINLIIFYAYLH